MTRLTGLLAAVRASGFAHVTVRVGNDRLELIRERHVPAEPPTGSADGATPPPDGADHEPVAVVPAPAPGLVAMQVRVEAVVECGDVVGFVEGFDDRVPVVAPLSGRVEHVLVGDGEFVEYGQEIIRIMAAQR